MMSMDTGAVASVRKKISVRFRDMPSLAAYILHHELDDFVKELVLNYEQADIPVFRFFKSLDPDKKLALVTGSTREMLALLAANNADLFVEQSISNWVNNQLPVITRDQVHSQDITLVNYVKGKVFRQFISRFTEDLSLRQSLVEEIDRLFVILNSELFAAYIDVQRQEIGDMNEALKKREQQLLEAQEVGQVGSFEWDLIGKQSSFTPQMFRIFEMEGPSNLTSFLDDVHPEDREKVRKALERAFVDGHYECEYRYLKNNREKVIYSRGKVQFVDGRPARMVGTVSDVTERYDIVRKLQESEKLHKQAQALTHIGNWSWAIHDNRITWSDEMYRIYGLAPQSEEITYERFASFIHPDDRQVRMAEIQRSLERLEVDEYHFRIVTDAGETKVLRGKGEVIAGPQRKPMMMLGTCQDVTKEFMLTKELRERERYLEELNHSLQAANQQLSRTNEELESFNFIASHDLQEPLRKIQVYSNRILENGLSTLPDPLPDYFTRISNASRRMQRLIEDFLAFSQTLNSPQPIEAVNLNQIVDEIRSELGTRIDEKQALVEVQLLPVVYGIPFQLKQLMTNLIGNALKYARPEVRPHIIISGSVVSGSEVPIEGADPTATYTMISVADNGIGFEPKYATKIFELFQRLHSKDLYSGTGIGLALCKKVVQHLHGYITATSEPGKGSVFSFYVPVQRR